MVSNVLFSKFCCFHFKIPFKERFEIAILELGRRDPVFGGWLLCLRCVLLLRFASFAFQSPHSSGSKVFLWHRSARIVIVFCKPFVANHHHCHQHQRIWRESTPKITTQSITIKLSSCDAKFRNINISDCDRHRPHHQHIWRESTSKTTTPSTTVKSSSWTQHLQASHQHFELCHRHRHQHIWRESASKTQHHQEPPNHKLKRNICKHQRFKHWDFKNYRSYRFSGFFHLRNFRRLYIPLHSIGTSSQHTMPLSWSSFYSIGISALHAIPLYIAYTVMYQVCKHSIPLMHRHYIPVPGDPKPLYQDPWWQFCCFRLACLHSLLPLSELQTCREVTRTNVWLLKWWRMILHVNACL